MPLNSDDRQEAELASERERRFCGLRIEHGARGPDATVPGAALSAARYAVLSAHPEHGRWLNYCDAASIEQLAGANIGEGWQPVCYFDLDELDGPDPQIWFTDLVRYRGQELYVVWVSEGPERAPHRQLRLASDPHTRCDAENVVHAAESEVELLRRAHSDNRLARRYDVAQTRVIVVFNSVATRR
jgi:hypothetical protein